MLLQSFDIQGPSSGFNYVGGGTKSTVIEQANYANDVGQCSIGEFILVYILTTKDNIIIIYEPIW